MISTSTRCAHLKKRWRISPVAPSSFPTTAGSWIESPRTSSRLKATAKCFGLKETIPSMKMIGKRDWAQQLSNRIASRTGSLPEADELSADYTDSKMRNRRQEQEAGQRE